MVAPVEDVGAHAVDALAVVWAVHVQVVQAPAHVNGLIVCLGFLVVMPMPPMDLVVAAGHL